MRAARNIFILIITAIIAYHVAHGALIVMFQPLIQDIVSGLCVCAMTVFTIVMLIWLFADFDIDKEKKKR